PSAHGRSMNEPSAQNANSKSRCINSWAAKATMKRSSDRTRALTDISDPPALLGSVSRWRYKSSDDRRALCNLGSAPDGLLHVLGGPVAARARLFDLRHRAVARFARGCRPSSG